MSASIKYITTIVFSVFAIISMAQPLVIDKTVGVVGNEMVLKSEVEVQYIRLQQEQGAIPEDFRCNILADLLTSRMLLTQALLDSIAISEDEVEGELDRRIRYFISLTGSVEKLEEFYGKSVLEMKNEFRSDVKDQLLSQRMQGNIAGDVKITPAEVKRFFSSIPKDSLPYFDAEVEVGLIYFYPKVNKIQRQLAKDEISRLRDRIVKGEDFETMAILYSDDKGTAKDGGELPEFGRDDGFVREFVGASFRLKDGEMSPVIETQFGFHIIQMIKKKGERVKVRHILKTPKITSSDISKTYRLADSVKTLLVDQKISFTAAVKKWSGDEGTKNNGGRLINQQSGDNWFEIDQLGAYDRDIPFIIDTMTAGDYSIPLAYTDHQDKRGYRIIHLLGETKPHVADFNVDYPKLEAMALARKKQNKFNKWLKDKIDRTYINIDYTYADCEILAIWKKDNNIR